MWLFKSAKVNYHPIRVFQETEGGSADLDMSFGEEKEGLLKSRSRRRWPLGVFVCFIAALGFFIFDLGGRIYSIDKPAPWKSKDPTLCVDAPRRREWRTLSGSQKSEYIDAVRCLSTHPSGFRDEATLYDDFPWLHVNEGRYSHGAAAFLPWHRYYIQQYEHALRDRCGYTGHLVYWDWFLDWESLGDAPVFSPSIAFGGDGASDGPPSVGNGRCVLEGPFANYSVLYHGTTRHRHCLSRGFASGEKLEYISHLFRPEKFDEILAQPDYNAFFLLLESTAHDAIPSFIGGDFPVFTAPNDPIFFLHHTQLDRIWWLWQQRNPSRRQNDYQGPKAADTNESATLNDPLPMKGFAKTITVAEIMSTETDILCYRY